MWLLILVTVVTGYLLGNLNGAVSISLLFGHEDVRARGSGNAGLTNFIRNYGLKTAGLVILVDVLKAVMACMVGRLLLRPMGLELEGAVLGGVAVSLGHDFPALLGFRGGKGILCGLAVALSIDYRCALLILAVFAVLTLLTRYVSVGSVAASVAFGVYFVVVYFGNLWLCLGGGFIGLLAVIMHRQNIARLIHGTENKIGMKKKKTEE